MNLIKVVVVRVYLMESDEAIKKIVDYLKGVAKVRGVSLFRAVSGFGDSGGQTTFWGNLSLSLPVTIEFFDHPDAIAPILEYLSNIVKPEHIVIWEAQTNTQAKQN